MGFVDLFRPKWKHSDAEVRAAAVRELGPEETAVLEDIARSDQDAGVRRVAIKRLEDPGILSRIAREDADESLRQLALDKAMTILIAAASSDQDEAECTRALGEIADQRALAEVAKSAAHKSIRELAVQRLTDDKALAEVARNAKEPQVRIESLRQLEDVAALRSIAMNDERKEVCLAAVDRIADREALDSVARKAKNKTVRAHARKQLAALGGGQAVDKKKQSQWLQMCEMVEVLSKSSDWERAGQKIERAQNEWESMEGSAPDEIQSRFQQAVDTFFGRLAEHKERLSRRHEQERELQKELAERIALCEQVESLQGDGVEQRVEELRQRWEQMGPIPAAHREVIEQRFQKACGSCLRRGEQRGEQQDVLSRMESLCDQAERLVDAPKARRALKRFGALEQEWRSLEAPPGSEALQARFDEVGRRLSQREQDEQLQRDQAQRDNLQRLESLCERLEAAVDSDKLKRSEKLLRDAQSSFKRLGDLPTREDKDRLTQRYQEAREKLFTKVQELREADEWKRWSVVPKLEGLCERVEKLAEEQDLKRVSQELRKAQAAWKKAGPAPRDKAEPLWQRFKKACDEAYGRCQEYFADLEQQREENLKQKLALCEEAEQVAARELGDDRARWEETANQLKEMQGRWKKIGAVPRAQSDAVWARFRKACDQFFDKRQELLDQASGERDENLKQKLALCEEAEQLAAAELEEEQWEETANQLKEMQGRWKKIGPVPRAQSDAVWARFRKACDQFFDRRQQRVEAERAENQASKEALCDRLEALLEGEPGDAIAPEVLEIRASWRGIGPVPQSAIGPLLDRFNAACERAVTAAPGAFAGTELDPSANQKKQEQLVARVEELAQLHAPIAAPTPAGDPAESVEQMAEQLRDALAKNALRGAADEGPSLQSTIREVKRLQSQWRRTGPVPGEEGKSLSERFRAACDRIFALREPAKPSRDKPEPEDGEAAEENYARKETLCEQAEQLATAENPTDHQETVRELRRQWKAIGPVPKRKARRLWNRFRRACNRVMSEAKKGERGDAEAAPAEAAPTEEAPPAAAEPSAAAEGTPSGWDADLDSGWDDVLEGEDDEEQRQEEG